MHRWLHDYREEGGRVSFRPFGLATPGELADMTTAALDRAYTDGCREALIDVTRLYGFESPGHSYRRWLVRRWAHTVLSEIDIVVVCREEHMVPERPGLLAAMEEGLRAHICISEDEAIAWFEAGRSRH